MTVEQMDVLVRILAESSSPDSIFLEVAFLESWLASYEKRMVGIPVSMMEAALPFLEEETGWKPKFDFWTQPRLTWARMAAATAIFGLLASSSGLGH
jgi:hypothetical protein